MGGHLYIQLLGMKEKIKIFYLKFLKFLILNYIKKNNKLFFLSFFLLLKNLNFNIFQINYLNLFYLINLLFFLIIFLKKLLIFTILFYGLFLFFNNFFLSLNNLFIQLKCYLNIIFFEYKLNFNNKIKFNNKPKIIVFFLLFHFNLLYF